MFYPKNVAISTVNAGILTGPYTIWVVDLNSTNATNPIYTNLTVTLYIISKLPNPSITNFTMVFSKRININPGVPYTFPIYFLNNNGTINSTSITNAVALNALGTVNNNTVI